MSPVNTFARTQEVGTVAGVVVFVSSPFSFRFFSVYGQDGGKVNTTAAVITSAVIEAIHGQWVDLGKGLILVGGDSNATPPQIPALDRLIQTKSWLDVGRHAPLFGATGEEPSCLAPSAKTKTRRDVFVVCPKVAVIIKRFQVLDTPQFATHALVEVGIAAPQGTSASFIIHEAPTRHVQTGQEQLGHDQWKRKVTATMDNVLAADEVHFGYVCRRDAEDMLHLMGTALDHTFCLVHEGEPNKTNKGREFFVKMLERRPCILSRSTRAIAQAQRFPSPAELEVLQLERCDAEAARALRTVR